MSDKLKQTIRIKRGEKVGIDDQGHSVWTKPVDELAIDSDSGGYNPYDKG